MQSPVTGHRSGATSAVRCVDVAGLVAASLLRRNPNAEVIAFSDDVVKMPRAINPRDSVMTNAQYLASLPSGGTACSAPLRHLNARGAKGDLVVYVSDNQSWADFAPGEAARDARHVHGRGVGALPGAQPEAKLVLIDLQPYGSTQVAERSDVLNVGGFSDAVFDIVSLFTKGELGADHSSELSRARSCKPQPLPRGSDPPALLPSPVAGAPPRSSACRVRFLEAALQRMQ